jgi:hypothetical protein
MEHGNVAVNYFIMVLGHIVDLVIRVSYGKAKRAIQ